MNALPKGPEHFDFNFPELDTLVRVEVQESDVTIRMTRDSFSPRRKRSFVHELASEGFIPEDLDWATLMGPSWGRPKVRWTVDTSWLQIDDSVRETSRRLVLGLFSASGLMLAVLMALVFTGHLGNVRVGTPPTPPAAHAP